VLPAHEVIASATHLAAPLLTFDKPAGVIAEGALADLIVVDGDPLKDLTLLTKQGRHMPVIMQGGRFMKRERLN
jgi:imidazolonepropionase-like amidohydrolase